MLSFDDLESYVNDLNMIKNDNCCLICHLGTEKECDKISCGHYYHKNCIINKSICPYCNKVIIPQTNNSTISQTNNSVISQTNNESCKSILKSGKNKGLECGRKKCGYHK